MEVSSKISMSDDEEDLDALRFAALQSIKKKNELANNGLQQQNFLLGPQGGFKMSGKGMRKRGKFFPNHIQQGRGARNGQFNNRIRNPNLISITTVDSEENLVSSSAPSTGAKLILPQDRYLKSVAKNEVKSGGPTSKFDRYDNSDDDSESDEDEDVGSETSETQESDFKKSDSLEDIMKELEEEISGEQKLKKDTKIVKNKIKHKKSLPDSTAEDNQQEKLEEIDANVITNVNSSESDTPGKEVTYIKEDLLVDNNKTINDVNVKKDFMIKSKDRDKPFKKSIYQRRNNRNFIPKQNMPFIQQNIMQTNPLFASQPPQFPMFQTVMNPVFPPVQPFIMNVPPPNLIPNRIDRPISPLNINTENLNDIAMAPLSPRSAAFVLQNRAIIEKRKRSPRRSYSRSPSPRFRHSKSPRRSITPKRSPRRSLSPKRGSLSPRHSPRSPRRMSRSPRRKSLSPARKYSPSGRTFSPKKQKLQPIKNSVYNRLGVKIDKTDEVKKLRSRSRSRSGTPLRDEKIELVDPVLEARRKKFETNELQIKGGVIRLKLKEETNTNNEEQLKEAVEEEENAETINEKMDSMDDPIDGLSDLNEDELLFEEPDDTLDLDPAVEHLLSDLESDSENEGRFKTRSQPNQKSVPIIPFSKLVNGGKPEIKDSLEVTRSLRNNRTYKSSRSSIDRDSKRRRNLPANIKRSPINKRRSPTNIRHSPTIHSSRSPVDAVNKNEKSPKLPLESLKDTLEVVKGKDERKVPSKFSTKLNINSRISSLKSEKKPPITTPIENKKIEIKIRNPSKYNRVLDKEKELIEKDLVGDKRLYTCRKVEVKKEDSSSESETEIIIENEESSDEENSNANDGDLRAQLSRKRAERQFNKHQPIEGVTSRLLQSALQSAVYKKPKKSKKDKEAKKEYKAVRRLLKAERLKRTFHFPFKSYRKVHIYEQFELRYNAPDGRIPIHLRLGIANDSDIFVTKKKKTKKRKTKGSLEQVLSLIAKYFIY